MSTSYHQPNILDQLDQIQDNLHQLGTNPARGFIEEILEVLEVLIAENDSLRDRVSMLEGKNQ